MGGRIGVGMEIDFEVVAAVVLVLWGDVVQLC